MEEQQPSSTQDLLIPSPDTTLAPAELTAAQILDYFRMPDGLLDSPRLLKSYQALNKTLWSTQLQVNELIEKNRLLEMSMPSRSKKGHDNSLTPEQTSDIRHFAHCCVTTIDPWADDAEIFQVHESVDNTLILSPERYESPESEEQGLYAEVYTVLKEEHHFFFKRNYSPAVKKFIRSASDGHSACVSHVKHEAFYTIFGALLPPSAAVKGFDPFSDPICQQLLGFDAQKKVYSTLPPIFWPNTIKDNNRYLFQSEILMNILLAIFFGATSINERKIIKKKPTNAVLWNLERITPGAIAFAAIIARYVLSGDEHFDKRGGCSLIPYAADFKFYKMTIIKNLNKTHMMETVTSFNCCLFEGRGSNRGDQSRSDEYEIIDIGDVFTDSSGSDDNPFDVQVVDETIARNSEPASPATADVAVDELAGSVAGVTLDTATSREIDPTATGPENRSEIDVMETGRTAPSEGSKRRGPGRRRQVTPVAPQPQAPPARRNTHTTHRTQVQVQNDDICEEDDIYGS
ncbi:hypothetical protein IW261DRAFT_1577575 [Armillaria novae-zelandiae]|uniref:Uncharacterized protein n=1 Tax=Armillaria novae-zelandiae TaxID=153914 RepID=A0AA39T2Y3_9AGAR|nr:hypothetical protein IW261DRAFT_1577575 [Armillaria novae-zelandiae]